MKTKLNRTIIVTIMTSCFVLVLATFIANIWSGLFYADYEQVINRFSLLKTGSINLADFVFLRQVDHPHVLVYLFSYIDAAIFGGHALLLTVGGVISAVLIIFLLYKCIEKIDQIDNFGKVILALCFCILFFGPLNYSLFTNPFQFVVLSFAGLVVAGIHLVTIKNVSSNMILPTAIFSIAIVAHGAGVILLGTLLFLILYKGMGFLFALKIKTKGKGSVPLCMPSITNNSVFYVLACASFVYILYSVSYPASIQQDGLLHARAIGLLKYIPEIPSVLSYILGHSLVLGVYGETSDVIVGTCGLLFWGYYIFISRANFSQGVRVFILISAFGVLSLCLSIGLNLLYLSERKASFAYSYFYQDRYVPYSSMFWAGFLVFMYLCVREKNKRWQDVTGPIPVYFIVIVLSVLGYANYVSYQGLLEPIIRNTQIRHYVLSQFIKEKTLDKLSACLIAKAVGLPPENAKKWAELRLNQQMSLGLGPFSTSNFSKMLYKINDSQNGVMPSYDLLWKMKFKPANFSDVNWANGIYKNGAGFFTESALPNIAICDRVIFADGDARDILQIDGKNIWIDGKNINPSDGFPNEVSVFSVK